MRTGTILIVRYIGTSSKSSDIYSIFDSIQKQIEIIFKIDVNRNEYREYKRKEEFFENKFIIDDEIRKKEEFINKLYYVSEKYLIDDKKPLVILLDSIDQLIEKNHDLKWFFKKLPKNLKIVYSSLKGYKNIFEKLNKEIKIEKNILEIKPLLINEAKMILIFYMTKAKKKLNDEQEMKVNKMIEGLDNICPLQIKLIFDIISKWKSSYKIPDDFLKCKTSVDLIKYLFQTIENGIIDNEILFKHCLFYLTLFEYRGISENEFEDILSIDDTLLTSVFEHQHPPVRRFPMGLWYRLKYEFKDYLTNKVTDDAFVIAW